MFGKNKDKEQKVHKLSGPRDVPQLVVKYLESNKVVDSGTLPFLKSLSKSSESGNGRYDIRIFDPADAEARHINVHNYDTLTEKPELTIAEGWYDEATKSVELAVKKTFPVVKLFTNEEIARQIEELKEPGSSVFFYTNAGTGSGGPLGKGAALIKNNIPVDGKKSKKYTVYGVNVIDMQPSPDGTKIFDTDKPVEIARWVADLHKPRLW
jgi:hypothetical protein